MTSQPVVAVTGADGQVGRALLRALQAGPGRTLALTRGAADLPADRVIAGPLDSPTARAALMEADCVVHLAGALRPARGNSYRMANVQTAEAVARALADPQARARRVVFLSYVGAGVESRNAYLQTKGAAERILSAACRDAVIFRCTHIMGAPESPGPTAAALRAGRGGRVVLLGSGTQAVAPVYLGDVIAAIQAAMTDGPPGVYELAGPDRMSLDELVRLLNPARALSITHVPGWLARAMALPVPGLPGPLVDVMLRDSVGDPARALAAFGLTLTSLRTVWSSA